MTYEVEGVHVGQHVRFDGSALEVGFVFGFKVGDGPAVLSCFVHPGMEA